MTKSRKSRNTVAAQVETPIVVQENQVDPIEARIRQAELSILRLVGAKLDDSTQIHAYGATSVDTVRNWCEKRGSQFGDVEVEVPGDNFQWALRFTADGDSMKAAGIVLKNGRHVMTWWK